MTKTAALKIARRIVGTVYKVAANRALVTYGYNVTRAKFGGSQTIIECGSYAEAVASRRERIEAEVERLMTEAA